jgi:hypothetical protein
MSRFVRLSSLILNLDAVAVIRPMGPDTVTVVSTLGHVEYIEGQDAVDLIAYVIAQATRPVPSGADEVAARAWINERVSWDEAAEELVEVEGGE